MNHNCVKLVNEKLAAHNTRLPIALNIENPEREMIALVTVKADEKGRVKPITMYASYCPFCGVKLGGAA